jgi:hypothetical protein
LVDSFIATCKQTLGLLIEKEKVKAERNNELTPLYDFTREGYLLGAIINIKVEHVFNILKSYSDINDSFILTFIIRFFKKAFERGRFAIIVDFFFKDNTTYLNIVENGRELLKLFLGVRHSLNWIIPFPDSFLDTLHELDDETKKMVLFHFKLEIEEYYNGNYLVEELRIMEFNNSVTWNKIGKREDYSKLIAIPGKEWYLT